jgi:hypothetical protein
MFNMFCREWRDASAPLPECREVRAVRDGFAHEAVGGSVALPRSKIDYEDEDELEDDYSELGRVRVYD